jgi:hypothetical protein
MQMPPVQVKVGSIAGTPNRLRQRDVPGKAGHAPAL